MYSFRIDAVAVQMMNAESVRRQMRKVLLVL
jgi:hypothetical protein